jgi:hypothetical protein
MMLDMVGLDRRVDIAREREKGSFIGGIEVEDEEEKENEVDDVDDDFFADGLLAFTTL